MLAFFHLSSELRKDFTHKDPDRPAFYWFSDRYHSLFPKDEYFYLFVKNPQEEEISMRARAQNSSFDGLYGGFLEYRAGREKLDIQGQFKEYIEPAILMSFDRIVPDLIARYDKETDQYKVLFPEEHKGTLIQFFDENGAAIPFDKIESIIKVLPEVKKALPFAEAEKIDGEYIYTDWLPMETERSGNWL